MYERVRERECEIEKVRKTNEIKEGRETDLFQKIKLDTLYYIPVEIVSIFFLYTTPSYTRLIDLLEAVKSQRGGSIDIRAKLWIRIRVI